MTLILASVRPHDVLLTADGRSTTIINGAVAGIDDHCQKLFPIPGHPVVIAHMGENQLGGGPVQKFLGQFIASLNVGNFTISGIDDELRQYAHAAIRARFKALGSPRWGVNLWVAGFSFHEEAPSLIEVFWKQTQDVLTTEERHFAPTFVVPGGDGKNQIRHVDWHNIAGKSLDDVRGYHRILMEQAINANVNPNTVGGMIHELVITPAEWQWIQRPNSPPDTMP